MTYPIEQKLVIAVASSALFDLTDSDRVFREQGIDAYRAYQRQQEDTVLQPGVAFPLVKRVLGLNHDTEPDEAPVEVILLSKNDPDTGLRVFNSIESHGLPITRAHFANGGDPLLYMSPFNVSLFLSANGTDVLTAIRRHLPAGRVFPTSYCDSEDDMELRIAFDFDGVLADDSAERVFNQNGLEKFLASETELAKEPLPPGPLFRFLQEIAKLQRIERERQRANQNYRPLLRTAIFTSRNAPAHKRVVTTLRSWGIEVDETVFLGGIEKAKMLARFQPHIFFDDQLTHVTGGAQATPSAHVPFGVANEASLEALQAAYAEYDRQRGVAAE